MPSRFIYLLYRVALVLAFPLILVYVAIRCARNSAYLGTLAQRWGFLPPGFTQPSAGAIWIHAVSVGETIAAAGLAQQLRSALPGAALYVSVSTIAARELAAKRLAGGIADGVFYVPLDYVGPVRRVLRRLRPSLVIIIETEIWPNLWRETKRSGAGLIVINGRISDKAWPRYKSWRGFFGPVLRQADRILAQTEISQDRFRQLGAGRVELGGNLKYDFDAAAAVPPDAVRDYVAALQPGPVWVAASTMPPASEGDVDEDEVVLDVFSELAGEFPSLILVLAPRRPERFATAEASLRRRGIGAVRRSALAPGKAESARVLLLDSMGELAGVFRLAEVVFMGGTLCRRGGHNILEPAFYGKAIVTGPHMENFPEIAGSFRAAHAYREVADAAGLAAELRALLGGSAEQRSALGERARAEATRKTGATRLAVEAARQAYELALPRPLTPLFARLALAPLAAIWRAGSRWRQRTNQPRVKLDRPVISIGGISAGGSGKTPFALWLAGDLRNRAKRRPAFLTRGYRRVSSEACTIVPAGGPISIERTGDEAQLLVRSGLGPVGICADRSLAALRLSEQFSPDLFILDDGFQHARLSRDLDIVVIDALDPFPGFEVIPAGRLREPLEALRRAGAFVIMRAEPGRTYEGIVRLLQAENPGAPVFRARLEPGVWRDAATGQPAEVRPGASGAAFCGLGNPASFWRSLARMGIKPCWQAAFPDHHRYHLRDLKRLAEDAHGRLVDTLWTTEKDVMNLPAGWPDSIPGCRVLYLGIAVRMEEPQEFAAWFDERFLTEQRVS